MGTKYGGPFFTTQPNRPSKNNMAINHPKFNTVQDVIDQIAAMHDCISVINLSDEEKSIIKNEIIELEKLINNA